MDRDAPATFPPPRRATGPPRRAPAPRARRASAPALLPGLGHSRGPTRPVPTPAPEPAPDLTPPPEPEPAPGTVATPEPAREAGGFDPEPAREAGGFDQFLEEQAQDAPAAVVWYAPIRLPRSVHQVLGDPALYGALCVFCREMVNVRISASGQVDQAFCESCRGALSRHERNRCQGGTGRCEGSRYVDGLGAVAPLCRGCYETGSGRASRRTRARRGRAPLSAFTVR